jgi:autotransporter-associated beta strand protein
VIAGDGSAELEISGTIRDDHLEPRAVTKQGSSTVLLSGPQTYTGSTTLDGGSFLLNAGASLSSPTVVVQAGATLGGNGTVTGSVTGPGTVSPGQSVGTLTASGNVAPGELVIEVDGAASDLLAVSGELDLTSATLTVSELGDGFAEGHYIIASYGSRNGTFSAVAGLPASYIIDYNYNDGSSSNHIALVDSSTLTPYQIWTTGSILGDSDADFEADPNADGVQNGLAFFLGASDAHINATSLLPAVSVVGSSMIYRFDRADTASALDFTAEYSSNLSFWTPAQDGEDGVSIETDDNGSLDQITVSLPMSLAAETSLFVRLAVTE